MKEGIHTVSIAEFLQMLKGKAKFLMYVQIVNVEGINNSKDTMWMGVDKKWLIDRPDFFNRFGSVTLDIVDNGIWTTVYIDKFIPIG